MFHVVRIIVINRVALILAAAVQGSYNLVNVTKITGNGSAHRHGK